MIIFVKVIWCAILDQLLQCFLCKTGCCDVIYIKYLDLIGNN